MRQIGIVGVGVLAAMWAAAMELAARAAKANTYLLPGIYLRMAAHPGRFIPTPGLGDYGFRVLTPWAVSLLPLPRMVGFGVWTAIWLGVAAGFLFAFLRAWLPVRLAAAGVALFVAVGPAMEAQVVVASPDAFGLAATAAVFWLLQTRRYLWTVVPMVLAAANHEAQMTLLVPIVVVAIVDGRWQSAVAPVTAGLGGFALLRYTPLVFGFVPPHFGYLGAANVSKVWWLANHEDLRLLVIPALLVLAAVVSLPVADRRLRAFAAHIGTLPFLLVVAADRDRMLGMAFPAVLCVGGVGLCRLLSGDVLVQVEDRVHIVEQRVDRPQVRRHEPGDADVLVQVEDGVDVRSGCDADVLVEVEDGRDRRPGREARDPGRVVPAVGGAAVGAAGVGHGLRRSG